MSAAEVLAEVRRRAAAAPRVVLGIVGPPGVGKTYVAARFRAVLQADGVPTETIAMDGFHLSNVQLDRLGLRERKGSPETFDVAGLVSLLRRIREPGAEAIFVPDYDRELHEPVAARRCVEPGTRVVVVEGNYLLHDAPGWAQVRALLDVAWHLDAPESLRGERLVARHVAGGRSPEEARVWVEQVDRPNAALIERGRTRADFLTDASRIDSEIAQLG
ncbi:nucleoside/nucleotide kinase family protein [Nocardioides pacificus]